jgi:alpha-tubulin suppressor-like RCC1 family protein
MRRRGAGIVVVVLAVAGGLLVGNDPSGGQSPPTEGGTPDWRSVSAGRFHTCGIRTTGRLYCWGSDIQGQLGNTSMSSVQGSPTEVAGGHTDWTHVSAGGEHTCGRRSNGRLYCWGRDDSGQVGDGNADFGASQHLPVAVGNATTWTMVSAGEVHTCGRRSNGRLYCWGSDGNGRLGNGAASTNNQTVPNQVAGNVTTWTSVSAGGSHTCGRRSNGRLYCWGNDDPFGQLGNGATLVDKVSPALVAGGFTNWSSVTAGVSHTCGRRSNGRLYCWGNDAFGELGNGATTGVRPTPNQVAGARIDWTAVDAGENHTCARRTSGRLFCWGRAAFGALGNGTFTPDRPAPFQIAGNRDDWTPPSTGMNHTCARTGDRRLSCWGNDIDEQLGNGVNFTNQAAPVEVDP